MAKGQIGSLYVRLGIDTAAFNEGLKQAQGRLKGFGDRMGKIGKTMSMRVTAPLAAAGAGITALATKVASSGNAIAKSAKEAGLGVEAFQELGFAIGQVSQLTEEQARQGFADLNARIGQAAQGSTKMAEAIESLGISMAGVRAGTVGTEQVFTALVAKLQTLPSDAEAAALASQLLGEEVGRRLGPALRAAGDDVGRLRQEFRQSGLGFTEAQARDAEAFVDNLDVMTRQMKQLGIAVGAALLPAFNKLAPVMAETIIPAMRQAADFVAGLIVKFTELPAPVQKVAALMAAAFAVGGPVLVGLGAVAGSITKLGGLLAAGAPLLAGLATVGKVLVGLVAKAGPIGLLITAITTVVAVWRNWDEIKEIVANIYGAVKTWIYDKMGALFDWLGEKLGWVGDKFFELYDRVVGNSYVPDMIEGIAAEFARLTSVMVNPAKKATSDTERAFKGMSDRVSVAAPGEGPRMPPDAQARATAEAYSGVRSQIDGASSSLQKFGQLGDSIFQSLMDGTFNWRDALQGVLQTLGDIAKQQLGGGGGSGGGGLFSSILSIAGSAAGAYFGGGFSGALSNTGNAFGAAGSLYTSGGQIALPAFANGGFVPGGTMAMVGERGPEPVFFGQDARVMTNRDMRSALVSERPSQRPVKAELHVHGVRDANSFERSRSQIESSFGRAADRAMRRND